ncbi:MAG: hypothetical protein AAF191_14850, partial [Verrucomicrobiota bacterium]
MKTVSLVLLCLLPLGSFVRADHGAFVFPGKGATSSQATWGHREGLRIGLAPNPGPEGLIRVYAPYLHQAYPRMVNFISIEPLVRGEAARGQSELEMSRDRPGEQGLSFWATGSLSEKRRPDAPFPGFVDSVTGSLHVFIHTEPFANGAQPVVECVFVSEAPREVLFIVHAGRESADMAQCVLSSTMGNYGLLRRLHFGNELAVTTRDLWEESDRLDRLGFYPWRTLAVSHAALLSSGRYQVGLSSDVRAPSDADYEEGVPKGWRYAGKKAFSVSRNDIFKYGLRDSF